MPIRLTPPPAITKHYKSPRKPHKYSETRWAASPLAAKRRIVRIHNMQARASHGIMNIEDVITKWQEKSQPPNTVRGSHVFPMPSSDDPCVSCAAGAAERDPLLAQHSSTR